ncbi:MAG: TauD/TfdA family dioxygenase [Pseudomonas sp.]|uniref:TauD/TfdA family dioxygenase n=1 Tax=Pseudomonas sp. TaxID=306 RepID=UPI003391DA00
MSAFDEGRLMANPAAGQDLEFPLRVQVDLAESQWRAWLETHRVALLERLQQVGAVLLRGLPLRSAADFQQAVALLAPRLRGYAGGTSPRRQVVEGVYTSTEYPPHLEIPLHNEMAYSARWPQRLFFFCAQAAAQGGETPVADSRRILARLPPALVEQFERRQLLYVRNLASAESRYNAWTQAFETTDPAQVEATCRDLDIDFQWQPGGGLRIREVRPALRVHPQTGERVWFNQAHLFHASNTPLASQVSAHIERGLPMAAYYGDGGRIDNDSLDRVRAVLRAERHLVPWQAGDLLLLDNLLAAHGRMPFEGPRQVLVAMA